MTKRYCAFCGLADDDVKRMFPGPARVNICVDCVELMHGMRNEPEKPPRPMREFLHEIK